MYVLTIDQSRCADCGNCERRLPGLHSKVIDNKLLVNEVNSDVDFVAIFRALADCLTEALSFRRFNG
jgi:ferredoxin